MVQDQSETDQSQLKQRIDDIFETAYGLRESEQWDRMLELAEEGRALSESIGYHRGLAFALGLQAFVNYIHSSLHLAIDQVIQGLALSDGDLVVEARLRGLLAMIHWSLGNYDDMTREGSLAFELYRKAGLRLDEAFSYLARGGMSQTLGDLELARADMECSIEIFQEVGSTVGLGRAYAGLAGVLAELGEVDRAQDCLSKAYACAEETGNQLLRSRVLNDAGLVYMKRGDLESARRDFEEALRVREQGNYRPAAITSMLDLARLHLRAENYPVALEFAQRAENAAFELGTRPKLADAHQLICQISERTGDLAEALRRLRAYQVLREQINGEQSRLRVETFRLMTQIESLRAQQAEQLNLEKMAAVGSLVAALTHEMNSPLGVIRSAADTTVRAANKLAQNGLSDLLRSNARLMAEATDRISVTINRLKGFAGVDLAEYREADLLQGVDEALAILAPSFGDRIEVIRECQPLPLVRCYAAEMNQVFLHLLRNAGDAIDGAGSITVCASGSEEQVRIRFTDTGRGIPADKLAKIFEPTFNDRGARVRASLSLFSCLSIVKKHRGELQVSSRLGSGSTFTITLPVDARLAT
jgi:signal transduction histidine kinase